MLFLRSTSQDLIKGDSFSRRNVQLFLETTSFLIAISVTLKLVLVLCKRMWSHQRKLQPLVHNKNVA